MIFLEVGVGGRQKQDQTQAVPLDFKAAGWTLEEVALHVFAGGSKLEGDTPKDKIAERILKTLSDQSVPLKPSPLSQTDALKPIRSFFRSFRNDWDSNFELPPIVWCGLAFQFWLAHGGCNEEFQRAFADWIKTSGNCAIGMKPIPHPIKKVASPRIFEIDLTVFLFERQYLRRAIKWPETFAAIGRKNSVGATVQQNRVDKIKTMLGSGSVGCIQEILDDALQSGSIANLSPKCDSKSGRYQYTGRHEDLCRDIFKVYKSELGRYELGTIGRALRDLVACKKHWGNVG